jgi:hypothetical protein
MTMPLQNASAPETATLWVCTTCYFAYHEGDYTRKPEDESQPWGLYDLADGTPTMTSRGISSGLMASEHADDCAFRTSNGDEDCTWDGECEQITFSRSSCEACGSHLAGTRHAMTQFYEETPA